MPAEPFMDSARTNTDIGLPYCVANDIEAARIRTAGSPRNGSVATDPKGFDRPAFLDRLAQESIAFSEKNLR
jgi:hypothetical protein